MSDDPRVTVPAELVDALRDATTSAWCDVDLLPSSLWLAARRLVAAAERPAAEEGERFVEVRDDLIAAGVTAAEVREASGASPAPVGEPLCRCGHAKTDHEFSRYECGDCGWMTCKRFDPNPSPVPVSEPLCRCGHRHPFDPSGTYASQGPPCEGYWTRCSCTKYDTTPSPVPVSDEAPEDEPISADHLRKAVLQWASRFIPGDRWDTEDVRDLETALGGTVENRCHHRSFDAPVSDEAEAAWADSACTFWSDQKECFIAGFRAARQEDA